MNAAWAQVTGPFYIPPNDEAPNVFAAFIASFLAAKTPRAMEVWKRRLDQLDPYKRYEALAKLAELQAEYDAQAASNWRAAQQAAAMGQSGNDQVLSEVIKYQTMYGKSAADASQTNAELGLEAALAMKPTTPAGQEIARLATTVLGDVVGRRRTPGDDTFGPKLTEGIRLLQGLVQQLPEARERWAVEQEIKAIAQQTAGLLGDDAEGRNYILGEFQQNFGTQQYSQSWEAAQPAPAFDPEAAADMTNRLRGGITPPPPGPAPAATAPPPAAPPLPPIPAPPAPASPATPSAPLGTSPPAQPAGFSSTTPTSAGTSPSSTTPPSGSVYLDQMRQQLERIQSGPPALGEFGAPLPMQEAYFRALAAKRLGHPQPKAQARPVAQPSQLAALSSVLPQTRPAAPPRPAPVVSALPKVEALDLPAQPRPAPQPTAKPKAPAAAAQPKAQPAAKAPTTAPAPQPKAYEWQGPEAPAWVDQREKDMAAADRLMDEAEAFLDAGNIEAARAKQAEADAILDRGP